MTKIRFEYWHDGEEISCQAVFEGPDRTVGIPGAWITEEARLIRGGELCVYDRDAIERELGFEVMYAMDEAAQAAAEARDEQLRDDAINLKIDVARGK